jgi:hypothetical protein
MTAADVHAAVAAGEALIRVPALVDGELVLPPEPPRLPQGPGRFRFDGGYGLRRPLLDGAGAPTEALQTIVTPAIEPERLARRDPELAATLAGLPFAEVLDYVEALRRTVCAQETLAADVSMAAAAGSPAAARRAHVSIEVIERMLDADGIADAVDRDLATGGVPGRAFLDGWVATHARPHGGAAGRIARELLGVRPGAAPAPAVRALPTRQLHIAAGNAHVVPVVSVVRALATKGHAVVKSSSEGFLAASVLGAAMQEVDARHPLTRAIALVCWRGGDRDVEDHLLAGGGFDRLVAWGTAETVASLAQRASGGLRTILFGPRLGVSLVGRESLERDCSGAAALATADSLIEDQAACSSSLVHFVEGDEDAAVAYGERVRDALRGWDAISPHTPSRSAAGGLRRLRRGRLAGARWWTNDRDGVTTSAVALTSQSFDLATHPGGRCIVVRRVDDLRDAVARLHPGIATVGVAPEARRLELRDAIAARGVSTIAPLGEAEFTFAGMPHDGTRTLCDLVAWTVG